uniref:Goadsporin biosynthetic protein n=1 Tax=Streptomyces sp. TP-A0584 TaxID=314563 RepID=Q3C2F6_9ACTN|nr:goadsporin biosynthetic protein [Streptomyces sp. TP-A0584]
MIVSDTRAGVLSTHDDGVQSIRPRAGLIVASGDDDDVASGRLCLESPWGRYALGSMSQAAQEALTVWVRAGGEDLDSVLASATEPVRRQVFGTLHRLRHLVTRTFHSLSDGSRVHAGLQPLTATASYTVDGLTDEGLVRLADSSYLRSYQGALVLESPLTAHRAALYSATARQWLTSLADWRPLCELDGFDAAAELRVLTKHLHAAGFLAYEPASSEPGALAASMPEMWSFHDLLFHSRSRFGRHDYPFGATFAHLGTVPPEPAVRVSPTADGAGARIPLYRPDWDTVMERDPSLTVALEGRTSRRKSGAQPLSVRQLGEFLYRVGRIRGFSPPVPGVPYETTSRPYPGGGAAYELELYATVTRCSGLASGIYHYDPDRHELVQINKDPRLVEAVSHAAQIATGGTAEPDVVFSVTSRMRRLSWKYESMAYATTLKNVGALYQTMYLVGTAMRLAPCALGSGNADLVAEATGNDYLYECSVGEFILSSLDPAEGKTTSIGARDVNSADWVRRARALLEDESQ